MTPWLKIGETVVHLEDLPPLLERSGLLKAVFKRLLIESVVSRVTVTSEEQREFQSRFLSKNSIETKDQLLAWLDSRGLTEKEMSQNILDSLKLERFKLDQFSSKINQIFLDTKPSRDRVVYSILRVKDSSAAQELYLRITEGDSTFTDLSDQHSQGPERDTGGLIGPIALSRLHPQLAELLRISHPGQLWHPIEIDGWWVIVRLDKFLPAQLDMKMEQQIRDECFEQWLDSSLQSILSSYMHASQHLLSEASDSSAMSSR